MRRVDILIIIGALSTLTLIFYPSYILHQRSKVTIFERLPKVHKKTTESVQKRLKELYEAEYEESDDMIPKKSWMDSIIVHGIHKPHLPEHSKHWERMHLFQKLMGLRPWPIFSPGPRHDEVKTSDEILSAPESTSALSLFDKGRKEMRYISRDKEVQNTSLIAVSSTTFQGFDRVYKIKDLYKTNHFWPHAEICAKKFGNKSSGIKLLVAVTSSAKNKAARRAIRFTWGHYATRKDIALVFILGHPTADQLDELIKEDHIFRDLVMGNTPASLMDNTLKTISLLEWVKMYCSNVHAVLKVKDDVFIHVPNLIGFLSAPHRIIARKTIWGKLMFNVHPERKDVSSPHFVPQNQFPGRVFPFFLLGSGYLVTMDAVRPLLQAAMELPHLRLEDVFITGTVANIAKVKRLDEEMFFGYNVSENICAIKKGIAFDRVPYGEQFHMWQQMHDPTIICRTVASNKNRKRKKKKIKINF